MPAHRHSLRADRLRMCPAGPQRSALVWALGTAALAVWAALGHLLIAGAAVARTRGGAVVLVAAFVILLLVGQLPEQ